MANVAVDVKDVSKRFRLAHGRYNSFKERLIHAGRGQYEDFWALKHLALQVREGETVGILGRNGSGKSTLLKCICGVLQPTLGEVVVRGKLAGLLELGAGFQQDLTGRENIYLNGSLLGMSKKEVDKVFDEIVDFSELEEFIDGPVKFYSSGMYVRLGFAVAVNVDPDILVIDEVLAVGDERFQRKCLDRVKLFQQEGRTILLVTHSPDQVRSICDRAVVLSHGEIVGQGPPGEAVRLFREGLLEEGATLSVPDKDAELPAHNPLAVGSPDPSHPVRVTYTAHSYPKSSELDYLSTGDSLTIGVGYHASIATEDVVFSIELRDADDNTFMRTDTSIMGLRFDLPVGPGLVNFLVEKVPLLDGAFTYSIGVQSRGGVLFDWREPAGRVAVMNPGKTTGYIYLPVRAFLLPPEPDAIARLAPEELVHLEQQA
ncbi:MAG TPA: polysaccharide ABC transporter ATP-binding protein [Acidimicrobiales bacterium]|nr:polysaccharide ABC transporter ATP-binding protein [Acidimicrobiales bacterium]